MLVEKDHGLTPHRQLNACGNKFQVFSLGATCVGLRTYGEYHISCVSDISDRKQKDEMIVILLASFGDEATTVSLGRHALIGRCTHKHLYFSLYLCTPTDNKLKPCS
jgi:hypothetical protein